VTAPPIILASASPRRAELLGKLGLDFRVVPSAAEELHDERLGVAELCAGNAELKAREVAARYPESLVVGADTLVVLSGKLFGKPRALDHARAMLRELSGQTHQVVTGVCMIHGARLERFADETEVTFRTLTDEAIDNYLRLVSVLDKAGAYGIQEHGDMLVEKISGSYDNVVGLPTEKLLERLRAWSATP
jgi:septum formation protein